jgi:DNA polymerase-3 subunit alpha
MPIPSAELTDDESEAEDEIIEVETDNEEEEVAMEITKTEVEEIRKITSLEMKSRKLKVKISKELLEQLEKLQVNFKLN